MQAKFVIFSIFMPENEVCFKKLEQTTFPVIKLLDISNLPEFNFKQFGTQSPKAISPLQ